MKRLILIPLILFGLTGLFAQPPRPRVNDNPQKAEKRQPPTLEKRSPTAIQPAGDQNSGTGDARTSAANQGQEDEVLRIDTNLVTIPVRVSDRSGRYIGGLTKNNFTVFEDNAKQEIAYFSSVEEPFTVALVLDMSYSNAFKINEIQAAATAFINRLHPNDKVLIVSFDEQVKVLCELTGDRRVLRSAIRTTKIGYGTSLYEAIDFVVNKRLKNIAGRKAIVLFTDGVDTTSRSAYAEDNLRDVYETDSLIYPVEYDTFRDVQAMENKPVNGRRTSGSPDPGGDGTPPLLPVPTVGMPGGAGTSAEDYRKAEEYLLELANRTSGRVYKATTTTNLAAAFTNIADELRQIYSLGFYPTEERAGKRRQLKVRVDKSGVVVRARDSYVVENKKQASTR